MPEVTSLTTVPWRAWRRSQWNVFVWVVLGATTRKLCSASRVTVTSTSMPPRVFSMQA